jgi:hypothetical protein
MLQSGTMGVSGVCSLLALFPLFVASPATAFLGYVNAGIEIYKIMEEGDSKGFNTNEYITAIPTGVNVDQIVGFSDLKTVEMSVYYKADFVAEQAMYTYKMLSRCGGTWNSTTKALRDVYFVVEENTSVCKLDVEVSVSQILNVGTLATPIPELIVLVKTQVADEGVMQSCNGKPFTGTDTFLLRGDCTLTAGLSDYTVITSSDYDISTSPKQFSLMWLWWLLMVVVILF